MRLHKKSPPELINRVAEVHKNGGGMPFINNDDVIIVASADGRKHKEPIVANMSPVIGADVSGPAVAINSYLKLIQEIWLLGLQLTYGLISVY